MSLKLVATTVQLQLQLLPSPTFSIVTHIQVTHNKFYSKLCPCAHTLFEWIYEQSFAMSKWNRLFVFFFLTISLNYRLQFSNQIHVLLVCAVLRFTFHFSDFFSFFSFFLLTNKYQIYENEFVFCPQTNRKTNVLIFYSASQIRKSYFVRNACGADQ